MVNPLRFITVKNLKSGCNSNIQAIQSFFFCFFLEIGELQIRKAWFPKIAEGNIKHKK